MRAVWLLSFWISTSTKCQHDSVALAAHEGCDGRVLEIFVHHDSVYTGDFCAVHSYRAVFNKLPSLTSGFGKLRLNEHIYHRFTEPYFARRRLFVKHFPLGSAQLFRLFLSEQYRRDVLGYFRDVVAV